MNINNPNFLQEVKENGYIKLDNIFTNEEIANLEINCMKALNEASKEHIHADTDFAKVVTVSEETLNDDNNFNFLKPFYNEHVLSFIKITLIVKIHTFQKFLFRNLQIQRKSRCTSV